MHRHTFLLIFSWMSSACSARNLLGTICMEDLGCFSTGGDFYDLKYRPISILPQRREVINTTFLLYTRHNLQEPYVLSASNRSRLIKAPFNKEVWTRIIVHGLLDNTFNSPWQRKLKDELLLHSDINCIIVDWSGGNHLPYTRATANSRVVGAEIALLLTTLAETVSLDVKKVHIIGHSLGSHIAGYAGERIEGLARITALDPAGPYFQNMPRSVRLDDKDADFVDVIHTDAKSILLLGFGMKQQAGHIDFYPNSGSGQPGCLKDRISSSFFSDIWEGLRNFVSCSHKRAVEFFMETINHGECAPIGVGCKDWKTFTEGKCTDCGENGSNCGIMGIRAYEYYPHKSDKVQPRKYLRTSGSKPYCLFHYAVGVKLRYESGAKDEKGKIEIIAEGQNGDTAQAAIRTQMLHHGRTYQALLTTRMKLDEIRSVKLKWKRSWTIWKFWQLLATRQIYVEYVQISIIDVGENSKKKTYKFCFGGKGAFTSGTTRTFTKC